MNTSKMIDKKRTEYSVRIEQAPDIHAIIESGILFHTNMFEL